MYMNQPNIKHRKVALVKESNSSDNSAMSHSARRVMDLLENYSSPLMEAKRISQFVKSARNDDTLDSSSSTISGSPYANKILCKYHWTNTSHIHLIMNSFNLN